MRLTQGDPLYRCHALFSGLWMPDLFFKKLMGIDKDPYWYLFCPDSAPNLFEFYGEEFEQLYQKYIDEKKYCKKLNIVKIWTKIYESLIDNGAPYMLMKDNINRKSNQKNLGTHKSSNLCTEITLYTSPDETAVCNLSSIALPKFIKTNKNGEKYFDFDELQYVTGLIVENLNLVIDKNYYPTNCTKKSNLRHRPIGIGVQGLSDVFCILKLPYESNEAIDLDRDIFETMYYAALKRSMELAKSDGPYESFMGSPASQGKLQFDLWKEERINVFNKLGFEEDISNYEPRIYDFKSLKEQIKIYGLRNSMLLAPMPTASTSQILGNNEGTYPIFSNLHKKQILSGEFYYINKYLMEDLKELGIYDKSIIGEIMENNGSIQNIDRIPKHVRDLYKTGFEIKQRRIIDHTAARSIFVCQSNSTNLYNNGDNDYEKISMMYQYAWLKGLKGIYYLQSRPDNESAKLTGSDYKEEVDKKIICNDEICLACSS